jgi:hypothetical protein
VHWSKRQAHSSIAQRTRSQECSATKHLSILGGDRTAPKKSLA